MAEKGRIVTTARRLRQEMTDAEWRIWTLLRKPPFALYRFRRQVPFHPYVADFASHGAKLVIEVDGSQHAEAVAYDERRTRYLESRGYRVLRFWNRDVLTNIEAVAEIIAQALLPRKPSPPAGEGDSRRPARAG